MSPVMKKRIRIYAFAVGMTIVVIAGIDPLVDYQWPKAVISILGLIVGILNIRGGEQMDRFLISAIGLKVTVAAFLGFSGVTAMQKAIIVNLEIFITAGLLYVALVGIYDAFRANRHNLKFALYAAAIILVVLVWLFGNNGTASWVAYASIGLLLLGVVVGYSEGPKNPDEGNSNVGREFLLAALGFQLASKAVSDIVEADFSQYEALIKGIKVLLEKTTIFTTSALLIIAFMSIFWVLDEITDN
ncbi:MAG: hypothetical protein OEZ02_08830 [Anaerolineae bacterium]|nr:hypothetical protein [Anaerolineae bacterium]